MPEYEVDIATVRAITADVSEVSVAHQALEVEMCGLQAAMHPSSCEAQRLQQLIAQKTPHQGEEVCASIGPSETDL